MHKKKLNRKNKNVDSGRSKREYLKKHKKVAAIRRDKMAILSLQKEEQKLYNTSKKRAENKTDTARAAGQFIPKNLNDALTSQ